MFRDRTRLGSSQTVDHTREECILVSKKQIVECKTRLKSSSLVLRERETELLCTASKRHILIWPGQAPSRPAFLQEARLLRRRSLFFIRSLNGTGVGKYLSSRQPQDRVNDFPQVEMWTPVHPRAARRTHNFSLHSGPNVYD